MGLLLAFVLLLLPRDLSEFGIGGLFNVKLRERIAAADKRADAAAKEVAYVTLGSASPSVARIRQATSRASSKSQRTRSTSGREPRSLTNDRRNLEGRLYALSSDLDPYVVLLSSNVGSERAVQEIARRFAITNDAARNVLQGIRTWGSVYEDELSEWARIRNTFIHYPERLSDDETKAAIALAERLLAEVGGIRLGRKTESRPKYS